MEEEDPESNDSDPEGAGRPDNEEMSQRCADGAKEDEDGSTVEEQQENTEEEDDWHTCSEEEAEEDEEAAPSSGENSFHNSSHLLRKDELLEVFKAAHGGPRCKDGQLTVGLVGGNISSCVTTTCINLHLNCVFVFARLGIPMWERVPPSTLFSEIRRFQFQPLQDTPSTFRYRILPSSLSTSARAFHPQQT